MNGFLCRSFSSRRKSTFTCTPFELMKERKNMDKKRRKEEVEEVEDAEKGENEEKEEEEEDKQVRGGKNK